MFKKFVSVFLCVITVFTFTSAAFIRSGGVTAEAASSITLPYYYYQMSDEAQEFYRYLRKAIRDCKSKIKLEMNFDEKEIDMVAELLIFHDPLTFNVKDVTYRKTSKNAAVFEPEYKYDKETYDKMVKAYDKAANKILNKLTDDMTTYSKIKTIHDEIIKKAVYDLDASNNDNIYGTLVSNKAKCDGYARTFTYVCGMAGIRTVTVIGSDLSESGSDNGHMWNKVYYNKKWYNVDVTWDDPISEMKDNLQYDYFMVSDKALKNTHKEDNLSFKVPKASDDTRGYYVVNKKYAESNQDVEKLIKSGLKSAAKKGKTCFSIKFASKDIMKYARTYINDIDKMFKVFNDVIDSTGKKLALTYSSSFDENMLTLRVYIFYENTKLEDYFIDPNSVGSDDLEIFEYFGIS